MAEFPDNVYVQMSEAIIAFERVLPDVKDILGDDNPKVVDAVNAMEDLREHLLRLGYASRAN